VTKSIASTLEDGSYCNVSNVSWGRVSINLPDVSEMRDRTDAKRQMMVKIQCIL